MNTPLVLMLAVVCCCCLCVMSVAGGGAGAYEYGWWPFAGRKCADYTAGLVAAEDRSVYRAKHSLPVGCPVSYDCDEYNDALASKRTTRGRARFRKEHEPPEDCPLLLSCDEYEREWAAMKKVSERRTFLDDNPLPLDCGGCDDLMYNTDGLSGKEWATKVAVRGCHVPCDFWDSEEPGFATEAAKYGVVKPASCD